MKRIKNKKGAVGHVEVILSFIIFISFILFLLIVLKPLKIFSGTSSTGLDIIESQILKNVSTKLSITAIKIDTLVYEGRQTESCFSVNLTETIKNPIIMKNESSEVVNAITKTENNLIYFNNSGKFYRIYSSSEIIENALDTSTSTCYPLVNGEYNLSVSRSYDVVSSSSLHSLFKNYNNNYEGIKKELGLKNEFIMSVSSGSEIILQVEEKKKKPKGIEVMARDVPIEVLNQDGELEPYVLNIQTWS